MLFRTCWLRRPIQALKAGRPGRPPCRRFRPLVESLEDRRVPSAIPTPPIYQNPFMAPNNFSEIHLNSYQTDTASVNGPASAAGQSVQQGFIGPPTGIAGTIAFNSSGQILTIWVGSELTRSGMVTAVKLRLIDPVTLKVLAEQPLPNRPDTGGVSFAGGYFYLDNMNRVVLDTSDQQIQIYAVQNNQFVLVRTYDLSAAINNPNDLLNSVLPDSAGNLWFITNQGGVGYVSPASGAVHFTSVRNVPNANPNETNTKSFATDGQGGVYVVSDYALYRFQIGPGGAPEATWRTAYDRGTRVKPGQNQQGSGTTPTVFGDFAGNQFVAIADNADPFMHVNVYDRQTGRLVAQQAVFDNLPRRGDTENSLIAVNHAILVENNYGNRRVASTLGPATTQPDIDRVDFDPKTGRSSVVWENANVAVPSIVSQLSTSDGLEYTYAKDARGWYWAALDFRTGALVAKSYVPWSHVRGGVLANNFYGGLTIGPDGSAYASVFGGLVAWRPVGGPVPATFRVTNSLDNLLPGSLRYAITQANLAGNGGATVEITPQVTGPIVLTNGELPINASMTIRNDSGAPVEIRQATADARVLHIGSGAATVTITGVTSASPITLDGGSVTGANGGGILEDGPTDLTLTSVEVIRNSATAGTGPGGSTVGGNGGGIYTPGEVALNDSAVGTTDAPNTATRLGGGIWAGRGVTLDASMVEGNRALDGGGIVVDAGKARLTHGSSVSHNSADPTAGMAGGILVALGPVSVSGASHVEDNHSWRTGGILVGVGDVNVAGGSTVDQNVGSDTAFGNGGILDVTGNVTVSGRSRIEHNTSGGMGSGAIVVVIGDVSVSGHSRILDNTGNGPGGGIAANFDGKVTVTDSQVNHNTGGAIGGGIVNFSGALGSVTVSRSQVNDNTLTDAMSLQQVLKNFFGLLPGPPFQDLAAAVGGAGGASMSQGLQRVAQAVAQASPQFAEVLQGIGDQHPLVVGGGIGTFLGNPVVVTDGSEVSGNQQAIANTTIGLGGGIFAPRSPVTIDRSAVDDNVAQNGAGGGLWVQSGPLMLAHSSVNDNSATGDGGGIWNAGVLTVLDSTGARNQAGGDGGGLFNAPRGRALVLDSEFQGDQASFGGGMANLGALAVVRSTVAENQAAADGGGIWSGHRLLLLDVLFADNSPNDVAGF
jgi:hypothetical protein